MHQILRTYMNKITSSIISDDEFKLVEQCFTPKTVKKKQFLLHEGSICKYMSFIAKGAMRQYTIDDKGIEHIVRFGLEEWWISDRESFTMLTPSKYYIDAIEDTQLLVATNDKLFELRAHSPSFEKLSRILDERHYNAAQERIQAIISYTAEEKFQHLMQNYPAFVKRIPQSMLASFLGITPETLSRVRKQTSLNNN
jgi:CRP-like cAMP-binding protein